MNYGKVLIRNMIDIVQCIVSDEMSLIISTNAITVNELLLQLVS